MCAIVASIILACLAAVIQFSGGGGTGGGGGDLALGLEPGGVVAGGGGAVAGAGGPAARVLSAEARALRAMDDNPIATLVAGILGVTAVIFLVGMCVMSLLARSNGPEKPQRRQE